MFPPMLGGDDPVALLRRLIRFDTTNPPGAERACVEHIAELLSEAGIETRTLARDPERPNLIARLPGTGEAPPLLLHGHVDVVPTDGQAWRHPPFEAAVKDGCVWGRGALDMKGGVAMIVWATLRLHAEGPRLPGDLVLAILSDEEAGSEHGAKFLVAEHPEVMDGVRYAIGEGGGHPFDLDGARFYAIKVAEKQYCRVRASTSGPGGHGSLPVRGGAMARLGEVLRRLEGRRLPVHLTPAARAMLEALGRHVPIANELLDTGRADEILDSLGPDGALFDALLHHTVNPTIVAGGGMLNVVPSEVSLDLDGRVLPGFEPEDLRRELAEVIGDLADIEIVACEPAQHEAPDLGLLGPLGAALRAADPDAVPIPTLDAGVTDARVFAELGIQTYGFLPTPLPPGFDRQALVHGADERIPVESLVRGAKTLYDALPHIMRAQRSAVDRPPSGRSPSRGG